MAKSCGKTAMTWPVIPFMSAGHTFSTERINHS
jgi:hypothetical protein